MLAVLICPKFLSPAEKQTNYSMNYYNLFIIIIYNHSNLFYRFAIPTDWFTYLIMKNTKKKDNNLLDKYSSTVKHILIPLPNFKRYHQTESETMTDDSGFIGRQAIISKLKSWLANKDTLTGAYLITGFRGMGKSSFVGKVLNELTQHHRYIKERYFQFIKGGLLLVTSLCCILQVCNIAFNETSGKYFTLGIILGSIMLGGIILYLLHTQKTTRILEIK